MVNGVFVADFPPKVNPNVLKPDVRKVADEFYKRFEAKMKRPPAGHAAAGFSAIWALFTDVLPKAKTFEPDELRDIALKLTSPKAHWSMAAASSSRILTRPKTRKTPVRICAHRSACGSGRPTAMNKCFRQIWQPMRQSWSHCRLGAAANLVGPPEINSCGPALAMLRPA